MENRQQELEDILKNAEMLEQDANLVEEKKSIKEKGKIIPFIFFRFLIVTKEKKTMPVFFNKR